MKKTTGLTLTAICIGLFMASATSVVEGKLVADNLESLHAVDSGAGETRWQRTEERSPALRRVRPVTERFSESQAKKILERPAREVLLAIKNRDGAKLATFVHPGKGVRFSLYGYASPEGDRRFTRDRIKDLFSNKRRFVWGCEDGSGYPIRLTARQYIKRWVYNRDFLRVKEIGYNNVILDGDATTNIPEVYPDAIPVTYYFPGADPDVPGSGWQSLCLTFEQKNRTWYLTGVITILQTI
ncbi:MAG TPA: hypothetical protein VFB82_04675 [Blastocatellia bacterium]|nr:hypothetical protein [Blastocatellia bacterium]